MRTATDGLFFHPDGGTAADVLKRLATGTTNYRLDDPFQPAITETVQELDRLDAQIERAEQRVALLEGAKARAQQRLEAQHAAKERFAETGEIDEVLYPSVEALALAEAAEQRKKIKETDHFVLPTTLKEAGWEADELVRVTDTEIIVTLRKRRDDSPVDVGTVEKQISKAVRTAMQAFCVNDGHYRSILRDRIDSRCQQPREPPDD